MKSKYKHLNAELQPLSEGIDPSEQKIPVKWVDVNVREEHESILRDSKRCQELGLDQVFEVMVYLNRWGGWLNEDNEDSRTQSAD